MGQILHKRATTTHAIRKEIQEAKGSISSIAKKFNLNWATVKKWKERTSVEDAQMGNGRENSVLTIEEDWLICETRKKTWFPLDELYSLLKLTIPKLTRSNLHRCLQFYNLSRVPEEIKSPKKKPGKFKKYEIGFLHIDITQFWLEGRKWYLFVAIDRVTKMAYAEIYSQKTIENALSFLENTIGFYCYKIHRILTDNGQQFTYRGMPKNKRPKLKKHPFTKKCQEHGIKHKLTKFYSPQTNGQVEKMNDILKSATLKLFHYDNIQELSEHLAKFLNYYNCQKKLKSLKFKSPYDFIIEKHKKNPKLFHKNPLHHCVGLNT
jgi:transposase InsO family protein